MTALIRNHAIQSPVMLESDRHAPHIYYYRFIWHVGNDTAGQLFSPLGNPSTVRKTNYNRHPSRPSHPRTMTMVDKIVSLWTFCPTGGTVSIPTSSAAPDSATVKTEKPQAISKAG